VTDSHDSEPRETPSQAIFIGWLALVLMVFALAWIGTGLLQLLRPAAGV
jgi:hypothetical protein